jgi:hypothetical protein
MLDIPIIAIMPQRPVTAGIILHTTTIMGFTTITILKIMYHTISTTLQVKTQFNSIQ